MSNRPKSSITATQKQQITRQQFEITRTVYSGIIPAEELAKFEAVCPGSANRILTRFEEQGQHRQGIEKTVIDANISSERLGQIFAFILFLVALVGGFVLIALDKNVYGISVIVGALVLPIALFLLGRHGGIRELLSKRQEVEKLANPQTSNEDQLRSSNQLPPRS